MLGRQYESNSNVIYLSAKTKDANKNKVKPYFSVRKRGENGYEEGEPVDRFSGNLTKIDFKEIDLKTGGKMELVTLTVKDQETDPAETYVIDLTFSIAARGLFNRILNLEDFSNLEISTWENDSGFEVLSLRQNGEAVKAKYLKDDTKLPQPEVKTLRGQSVKDYYEVDLFYKTELAKVNEKIKNPSVPAAPVKETKAKKGKVVVEEEDSEIPF